MKQKPNNAENSSLYWTHTEKKLFSLKPILYFKLALLHCVRKLGLETIDQGQVLEMSLRLQLHKAPGLDAHINWSQSDSATKARP